MSGLRNGADRIAIARSFYTRMGCDWPDGPQGGCSAGRRRSAAVVQDLAATVSRCSLQTKSNHPCWARPTCVLGQPRGCRGIVRSCARKRCCPPVGVAPAGPRADWHVRSVGVAASRGVETQRATASRRIETIPIMADRVRDPSCRRPAMISQRCSRRSR